MCEYMGHMGNSFIYIYLVLSLIWWFSLPMHVFITNKIRGKDKGKEHGKERNLEMPNPLAIPTKTFS